MANTPTTHYAYNKPDIGDAGWGITLNGNFDEIDTDLNALAGRVTTAESDITTLESNRVLKAGDTVTGTLKAPRFTTGRDAKGTVSGPVTFDTGLYTYFTLTTGGAITVTLSNEAASGDAYGIIIDITMGGAHTFDWSGQGVIWAGGVAPAFGSTGRHLVGLVTSDGGTTWLGNYSLAFA